MDEKKLKKLTQDLKKKDTEFLEKALKELEDMKDEYYIIFHILEPRRKQAAEQKKRDILNKMINETKYVECEYPSMGFMGEDGHCTLENKKQADALLKALKDNTTYYYAYILEWNGKGEYIVEPSYNYDHDNEIVYTATIKKVK